MCQWLKGSAFDDANFYLIQSNHLNNTLLVLALKKNCRVNIDCSEILRNLAKKKAII